MLCFLHALIIVIQNTLLFGEDFYARKSVRYGQVSPITREKAEPLEARMGVPSRSKADSTELIHGYDLSDKFTYLPDDSIGQQVKTSDGFLEHFVNKNHEKSLFPSWVTAMFAG